ncbi:MAG TPA: Crp/Fnr family transcriptional regulator [Magnetospirillaceae bacterium]|nr:Crp/Fnr family transcriptional regulator [Magnetospirillaceae bacterium]
MPDDTTTKIANFFTGYPLHIFDKRQMLARAESALPGVFYVVEGRVSQYDITPSGNEVVVNVFKPGAFFPMSWAMNDTPNHYFFEASTRVVAHVAPAADAVKFLKDNPDVTFDLLSRVYRGVDGVLRRMAHLMGGDSKSRLLFELLNTAYRFGESQPDGSVFIGLKEGDLARQSGLARETVNRVLQGLKVAGWVEVSHGGITVKNLRTLEDILGTIL